MTCIAYRKGVLAADSLITDPSAYLNIGFARKIYKTDDGALIGANGDCEYCLKFLEWAKTDRMTKPPKSKDDDGALLIKPNGTICYFYGTTWDELDNEYIAIGSGAPIALGAMFVGANAENAVAAACQWSMTCGGAIVIETL